MVSGSRVAALSLLATLGACQTAAHPPFVENGWLVYPDSFMKEVRIDCAGKHIALRGSHLDVALTGGCAAVRIEGEHGDFHVAIAPGGKIEIVGEHNDVWWHKTAPGAPPVLVAAYGDVHEE